MASLSKRSKGKSHSWQTLKEKDGSYIPLARKGKLAQGREIQKTIQSLCDADTSSGEDSRPSFKPRARNFFMAYASDSSDEGAQVEKSSCKMDLKRKGNSAKTLQEEGSSKLILVPENSTESEDSDKQQSTKGPCDVLNRTNRRRLRRVSCEEKQQKSMDTKQSSNCDDNGNSRAKGSHLDKEFCKLAKDDNSTRNDGVTTSTVSNAKRKQCSKDKESVCTDTEVQSHRQHRRGTDRKRLLSRPLADCRSETQMTKPIETETLTKHDEDRTPISKEQSFHFKARITKILNKFKEICSDFELRMEHVKLKHFRKKLVHQVDAKNMVLKSRNVFHKLRIELGTQEKDLMDFYQLWHNNCILERTNHTHEDSSWSESEISSGKDEFESGSNKLKNTCRQEQSIVSECDSEEIFSENEQTITCADSARTSEVQSHVSILKDSDNEIDNGTEDKLLSRADELASPILGKSRAKTSVQQRVTVVDRVNSEKVHDEIRPKSSQHPDGRSGGSIKNSKAFFSNCALNEIDKSVEDIFEDSVVEQANATPVQTSMEFKERNDPSKDESDSRNNISDGVATAEKCEAVKDKFSNTETASNPVKELPTRLEETLESEMAERHLDASNIAKEVSSTSTEDSLLDKEEQAKRAMLESDSDLQDDESFTDNQTSCSVNHEPNNSEKSCVQAAKIKSSNAEQQNKGGNKITKNDSVFDEHEAIKKLEISANRALLDSSSGNCESTVSIMRKSLHDKEESDNVNSENVTAKTALLVSSNSDSSSTENDNKTRSTDISPKTGNCSLPSKAQKDYHKKDCSKRTHDTDSDTSVGVRVKKRRLKLNSTCFENDEKLQMSCYVVIERLDGEILKKPARAWQKPRLHSDYKEFESLINLENLNRNSKKNPNDLSRNSSKNSSKKKGKAIKETEESLLDHLKKVENGEHVESIEEDSNHDDDDPVTKIHSTVQTNDDLLLEADRAAKNVLLSSNSDIEEQNTGSKSSDSEGEKMKSKSTENSKKRSQKTERDSSCNDQDKEKEQEKQKWRRNKILTMKLSDTDSDAERKKWNVKQEKLQAKSDGSQRDENSDNEEITVSHKKRRRRKILDSDSDVQLFESSLDSHDTEPLEDDDDFDVKGGKSKKRTRGRESPNTDSSLEEKKTKTKRKRIKKVVNDSDTDSSDEQGTSSQGTPGKKGRKNIRKVMKDKQVTNNTKQAAKEEEERIKRIADRQKLYNEIYEAKLAGEEKVEKLVLDFNPETKEELIVVHEKLVARLKPHQADGIKFMWDACFESVERLKTSPGSGCILAHCMGLGKTLQVIVLTHTILTHEQTGIKTILVVSPLSTVLNWVNEYATWLKDVEDDDIMVYELARYKKNIERKFQLQRWQETGGVLIIGYEMFRNLCGPNKNMRKNMKEEISKCLLDPGPDLIVCDEGHLLKNEGTALSKCMKQIKTLRRIVLTGTPLQNNLTEYHCMVQFVKPNLLGTKREFLNRFVNPITNGQFDDSTESDVKLMKKRAYVLNKMLKGCIQRFDYSVLMPFLPPKQEYVIFVTLSDVQIKMYQHYLDNFARQQRTGSGGLFRDFQALQRIWTHPTVLLLNSEKINERKYSSSDTEGSLEDFIDDDTSSESNSSSNSSSDDSVTAIKDGQVKDTSEAEVIEEQNENAKEDEWWLQYTEPEHFEDIRVSSKLVLLFGILKESEQIGDKVLVFSQSLYSLTLIEKFLKKIDNGTKNGTSSEHICGHSGTWSLGLDYFRLDGQTPAESRQRWCKIFNRATNTRARLFLISTRAGGLGINLTAANRVIIFDASWNPSHDVQSIFRIYRFGQKKPCYVYRFLATGTMEEKIYNRQITKLSLSCRVVDEQQIDRHYSNHNLAELYKFEPNTGNKEATLNLPKDRLLAEIFLKYKSYVETYHEHDSLLENKADEELNEEERKQAWLEYEEEKKGKPAQPYVMMPPFNPNMMVNQFDLPSSSNITIDYGKLQELIRKDYPNVTPQCQKLMVDRAYSDMYHYWEQQAMLNASANRILTQNTAMTQIFTTPQISQTTQISQIPQTIHKTQNLNKNKSGSMRELVANPFRIRNSTTTVTDIADDDIVEVPTSTRSSVSHILQNSLQSSKKNIQEEE